MLAAFLAGYQPKKMPVMAQTTKEATMAIWLTTYGIFISLEATKAIINPKMMPIMPPI